MKHIQPTDRHQYQMMNTLDELVASNHPVRLIDMMIEFVFNNNPEVIQKVKNTEAGRPGYKPTDLIKLLLYGFFHGISSSRKLEAETYRNIEVIWLLGGLKPDHWTISNYRKENGTLIKLVTQKLRRFLKDHGYIKLKTVAIDGSKVKAYANREMLSLEKIESKLSGAERQIEEYLSRLEQSDTTDDLAEEEKKRYESEIGELKKKIDDLERQKEILQQQGTNYISSADPDARLMRSRDGKMPAYNVQIAVDAEHKLIADSEVVNDETDMRVLPEILASIKEEFGSLPEEVTVDKGYYNPDVIEKLDKQQEVNIYASPEMSRRDKEEIKFEYDAQKDEYTCSAGKRLVLKQKNKIKRKALTDLYQGIECNGCPLRSKCTASKKGRIYHRYINQQWRDEYKTRMLSKTAKEKILLRKTLVEHPFGTMKCMMGKIPLFLRSLKKVSIEINLYTTAYNLKRLFNIESFDLLMAKMSNYDWKMA